MYVLVNDAKIVINTAPKKTNDNINNPAFKLIVALKISGTPREAKSRNLKSVTKTVIRILNDKIINRVVASILPNTIDDLCMGKANSGSKDPLSLSPTAKSIAWYKNHPLVFQKTRGKES